MQHHETSSRPRRSLRGRTRLALVVLPLLLALSACNVGSAVDTVGGWLGFSNGADTFSTPTFRVNEYVRVKLTVHVPASFKGTSIKVGLLCNGGTELDETLTFDSLSPQGVEASTEFTPALPFGVDCFINQELTNGLQVVQAVVGHADAGGQLDAVLTGQQ